MNQNPSHIHAVKSVPGDDAPAVQPKAGVDGVSSAAAYEQLAAAALEHEHALQRRALGVTRTSADASDLVQRTLERGVESLQLFEPGSNMRCWLMRIMLNLFLDDCRRVAHRPAPEPLGDDDAAVPAPTVADIDDPKPLWTRVTLDEVKSVLHRLRQPYREIYELRVVANLPYRDIAERLHIPLGTVATRLARGRKELCKLLMKHLGLEGRR
jgi:RNA polymerase sigma-70 factor (ECF subfamily)